MDKYVNKNSLYNEMVISINNDKLSHYANELILKLINDYCFKIKFNDDNEKEFCKNYVINKIITENVWKKFNPYHENKPNSAFIFFKNKIHNHLINAQIMNQLTNNH